VGVFYRNTLYIQMPSQQAINVWLTL